MKILALKSFKKEESKPEKNECFYSGFCLTDNINFAAFYVKNPVLKRDFRFLEEDLNYKLGMQTIPVKAKNKVYFYNKLCDRKLEIKKECLDYFKKKFKVGLQFYWMEEFLGNSVTNKVAVILGKKLVGILNTKKENENG